MPPITSFGNQSEKQSSNSYPIMFPIFWRVQYQHYFELTFSLLSTLPISNLLQEKAMWFRFLLFRMSLLYSHKSSLFFSAVLYFPTENNIVGFSFPTCDPWMMDQWRIDSHMHDLVAIEIILGTFFGNCWCWKEFSFSSQYLLERSQFPKVAFWSLTFSHSWRCSNSPVKPMYKLL